MPENPAEMPAESEGGGGGTFRPRRWWPNELEAHDWGRVSVSQLVNEIFSLRNRIHTLENNILVAKISATGRMALPEGESGGGGIPFPPFPPEIQEINPAELQPGPFVNRLVTEVSNLVVRFNQFEKQVSQQFAEIMKRLDAIKR